MTEFANSQHSCSLADCAALLPDYAAQRGVVLTPAMLRLALPATVEVQQTGRLTLVALRNMLAALGLQTQVCRGRSKTLPALHFTQDGLRLITVAADLRAAGRGVFLLPAREVIGVALPSRWSRRLLAKYSGLWQGLLAMSFGVQLVALLVPILTMVVYDRVAGAAALTDLRPLGIGLALATLGETVLRRLRLELVSWSAARLDHVVNTDIVERLLCLPTGLIEGASVTAQVARLRSFEAIRDFFGSPLFLNLFELPSALLMVLAVYFIAGPLAVVPLLMVGVYAIAFFAVRGTTKDRLEAAGRAQSVRQELLLEVLREPMTLRADGLGALYATRGAAFSTRAAVASRNSLRLSDWLEHGASWANGMAGVITLVWGVERVLAGDLTQGALLAAMLLTWRLLAPLAMFCTTLPRFEQMALAFRQLDQLQGIALETDGRIRHLPQPRAQGHLTFSAVGTGLGNNPLLASLTAEIAPGALVAIMGDNGVGKSTLLKIACGLQRPAMGAMQLDGIDIRQFDARVLRQLMAYMPQRPDLFSGTVGGNLRLAKLDATEDELWQALALAGAEDEVRQLPGRLQARVGSFESWQIPPSLAARIGLARVALRAEDTADSPGARVILLDELPYTLLHGAAEAAYRRLLEHWRGRRTVLFVTHRQDHARLADRVLYLRAGHTPVTVAPTKLQEVLAHKERA